MKQYLMFGAAIALVLTPNIILAKPAVKMKMTVAEGQAAQIPASDDDYQYLLHIPQGYNANLDERWPVIIFLHGSGERGTDINLVKVHGPPKIAANDPAFPFIIISPQLPTGQRWDPAKLDVMLDGILANTRADRTRVYLTGLSLGGMGSWDWASKRPDRFAAIAPVAARGDISGACALKDTPVWVFHGDSDAVVPAAGDIEMAAAVEQCGGKPRITIYPATGHDSWTVTYGDAALYLWFLRHRKNAAGKPLSR
jgi:predicted peptidase